MHPFSFRTLTPLLVAAAFGWDAAVAHCADKAQIQQAISKGAAQIKSTLDKKLGGPKSLAYVTLLKAGEPHDSPLMVQAVEHVRKNIRDGEYQNPPEHIYEAAIDITLLADLDGEKYKPEIQIIADYIVKLQEANGAWTYPPPRRDAKCINGDCSITHYACLGLWAASRAGVKVDPQVWIRVLNWQSTAHNTDGGFPYWPGTTVGNGDGKSTLNMTVNSVGTGMIAMLNLEPKRAPKFDKSAKSDKGEPAVAGTPPKKDTGALESVNLDQKEAEQKLAAAVGRIPESAFATTRAAFDWVTPRFETVNRESNTKAYYYYSLERMAALINVTKINDRDWYNECADELISKQNADGGWSMTEQGGPENDTCFAVLFLTRSTGKILKRTNIEPPVGGGLLSGGRGLPDDLKDVDANGNVKKKKEKSSLDDLLASLQDPDKVNLEDTQAELVEQIQLGDKTKLIGQKDMLLKLAQHPSAEIRRTAIWAIGRTGDLSLARFAILGLDDPDSGVMTESHNALCWTARKPKAFKLPEDPLEGIAADAGPDQKSAAIESWRRQALRLWGEWYLRNRPYADRGDEFETNLRNRLLELK